MYIPRRYYAGFSGGNDSIALCHWMMNNVPGCELFHINTGIGIKATREYVLDTCAAYHWPITVINALEDCGQDYDAFVRQFGFPGPPGHHMMYARLKERAVRVLVRRAKLTLKDKVLIATGLRQDESVRRMGYGGREINTVGAQVWVNAIYWWTKAARDAYRTLHNLPINPIAVKLGMSGECLCGAFAHPGELELVRSVDPETAARIDRLHDEVKDRFPWGWEGRPTPKRKKTNYADPIYDEIAGPIGPMCGGCQKSAVVQAELNDVSDLV